MSLSLVFLILALICFLLEALAVSVPRLRLIALGLAFWVLALMIGGRVGLDT